MGLVAEVYALDRQEAEQRPVSVWGFSTPVPLLAVTCGVGEKMIMGRWEVIAGPKQSFRFK